MDAVLERCSRETWPRTAQRVVAYIGSDEVSFSPFREFPGDVTGGDRLMYLVEKHLENVSAAKIFIAFDAHPGWAMRFAEGKTAEVRGDQIPARIRELQAEYWAT